MNRRQKLLRWVDQHLLLLIGIGFTLAFCVVMGCIIYPMMQREVETKYKDQHQAELAKQAEELRAEQDEALAAKDRRIYELEQELRPVNEEGLLEDRMDEFYNHSYLGYSTFESDTEFREYCKENYSDAVLPSNEWTAEEVIASWTEQPEIWGYYAGPNAEIRLWFTWTPDYSHFFTFDMDDPLQYSLTDDDTGEHMVLKSGWLIVDGIRTTMIDQQTYDIDDPFELVRQYQTGEWDGKTRRSHDGSTTVRTSGGGLEYRAEVWLYDERFDPEGLAWTEFETAPWWWRDGLSPELLVAMDWTEAPVAKAWETVNVWHVEWLTLSKLYVDLPLDVDMNKLRVVDKIRGGLLCAEDDQLVLYNKGMITKAWDLRFRDSTMEFTAAVTYTKGTGVEYAGMIYDNLNNKLIALHNDGTTEVVLDRVVYRDSYNMWGYKGDEFMRWKLGTRELRSQSFGTGVRRIDTSLRRMLLEKEDGTCYALVYDDNYNYVMKQLGTEPLEYYLEMYAILYDGAYF